MKTSDTTDMTQFSIASTKIFSSLYSVFIDERKLSNLLIGGTRRGLVSSGGQLFDQTNLV